MHSLLRKSIPSYLATSSEWSDKLERVIMPRQMPQVEAEEPCMVA
jgi:hypothetical protein